MFLPEKKITKIWIVITGKTFLIFFFLVILYLTLFHFCLPHRHGQLYIGIVTAACALPLDSMSSHSECEMNKTVLADWNRKNQFPKHDKHRIMILRNNLQCSTKLYYHFGRSTSSRVQFPSRWRLTSRDGSQNDDRTETTAGNYYYCKINKCESQSVRHQSVRCI